VVRVGSLVRYIPSPSATFKWEEYVKPEGRDPGIVLREVDAKGTTTRRYEIRWQNGMITEEWISFLEVFE
jgi:hypothetical protein